MKHKPVNKKWLKQIEDVYRTLGLQSDEVRKYFTTIGNLPGHAKKERETIFIEAGTTSFSLGELTNARLESTSE